MEFVPRLKYAAATVVAAYGISHAIFPHTHNMNDQSKYHQQEQIREYNANRKHELVEADIKAGHDSAAIDADAAEPALSRPADDAAKGLLDDLLKKP